MSHPLIQLRLDPPPFLALDPVPASHKHPLGHALTRELGRPHLRFLSLLFFPLPLRHHHHHSHPHCAPAHEPNEQGRSAALAETSNHYPFRRHASLNFFVDDSANILHALHHPLFITIVLLPRIPFPQRFGIAIGENGVDMNKASLRYDVAVSEDPY